MIKTLTSVSVFFMKGGRLMTKETEKQTKEIIPEIGKQVLEIIKIIDKIDIGKIINKFQQVFSFLKNNIEKLKNSNIVNAIALNINNKEVEEQISQVEKEINSLQKKIEARYFSWIEF